MYATKGCSSDVIGSKVQEAEFNSNERFPKKGAFTNVVPASTDIECLPEQETIQNEKVDLSLMRSVTPQTRSLLYDGFTKEGKGKYQYLQHRTMKKPEEKYDTDISSNWAYGWRQSEQVQLSPPKFGRSRVVRETFYRTRGVF